MKKTISFVRTFIPADLFKKEYALGGLTIHHLNEQLNVEMNAYECFECSVRSGEYTQDEPQVFGDGSGVHKTDTCRLVEPHTCAVYKKDIHLAGRVVGIHLRYLLHLRRRKL